MTVDSNQKMLSVMEILQESAQQTGVNRPFPQALQMLKIELSMPQIWKCREGNTLFIVHKSAHPGFGYFRALNADTAQNYVANSRKFIDSAYRAGFDHLVTQFDDPSILNIFKIIARSQPENMGYTAQRTNTGGYQVTVQIGKPRGGR